MKKILGIWDGHDAGVAIVSSDGETHEVIYAANEERFTRRKLEVGFPALSLTEAIDICGEPDEIVVPSTEPAKMLSRIFPSTAKNYYLFRRHKSAPSLLDPLKRRFKSRFTQLPPFPGSSALTSRIISKRLGEIGPSLAGISAKPVRTIDHHTAHLASAFSSSPFEAATVLSLDGIGDASSGAVAIGRRGADGHGQSWQSGQSGQSGQSRLAEVARFSGHDSIGLIFEEATRLLHMRELEDEGKVMALASHADLDERERGALSDLIKVSTDGTQIKLQSVCRPERRLKEALWRLGPERFAAAVQAFAETAVIDIAEAAIKITGRTGSSGGIDNLAVAGGVFANVKINRLLREKISREGPAPGRTGSSGACTAIDPIGAGLWVFPHMGDGGLAFGAAVGYLAGHCEMSPYLGTAVSAARAAEIACDRRLSVKDVTLDAVADRIAAGEALGWINGRMEYGPRALGARSILARPDDRKIRDKLNLAQKKRVFYQPFCPTLLRKEALRSLSGYAGGAERWMTSLYGTNAEGARRLEGVIGPDGSCRPQILDSAPSTDEEKLFCRLIELVEQKIGIGGVLNTSFNVHGSPIVRTETDAIDAFLESGLDALIAGGRIEITR